MNQEKATTPLERAAQAIRDETGAYGHPAGGFMTEGGLVDEQYFRDIVRAVLTAIREPSEDMLDAYFNLTNLGGDLISATPAEAFTAMIDAALADMG